MRRTSRSIDALREAARDEDATLASEIVVDVLVTVHPSYLLRVPDEDRASAFTQFVGDLKLARRYAPA